MRAVDGSAIQKICPRENVIAMSNSGGVWAVKTRCKSWRCKACKSSKAALMAWRIMEACSSALEPWFVSVTYGMSQEMQRSSEETRGKYTAAVVRGAVRDWREFCRRYRRSYGKKLKWLRIPELTKKRMLHYHLIMDNLRPSGFGRCGTPMGRRFDRDSDCACHTHQVSRIWKDITGWYVVDVRPVKNHAGMGNYLAGYLTKMPEEDYEFLWENGIQRRIEASRGFAKLPKISRPAGIIGYDRITIHGRHDLRYLRGLSEKDPHFKAVGNVFNEMRKRESILRRLGE